jgi:nitrate reductase gamma subunit
MTSARPPRERVILAHRRGARVVRTRVEVQEQTEVGDALVRGLMRAQLGLALRLAAVVVCAVAAVPLLLARFQIDDVRVAGIRLNWLILAALVYPVLYGVGRLYVRLAEQGERDFIRVVDGEP